MSRLLISDDRKSIIMLIGGSGQDISAGDNFFSVSSIFFVSLKIQNLPLLSLNNLSF